MGWDLGINNKTKVCYGKQDAKGSVENNARQLKQQLEEILEETKAEKVNIIAHSKGGLESRYLISSLGCADKVASLTTISTPHNGSVTVDHLLKIPQIFVRIGCKITDICFKIFGDENPQTYRSICQFKTAVAKEFNKQNPDAIGVYYQSYAFVMRNMFSDILFWFSWLIVHHYEGENDGLLSPAAVKWTNFQGVYRSNGRRGISHCDEVDLRRKRLTKKKGNDVSDITNLFLDIAIKLKEQGL